MLEASFVRRRGSRDRVYVTRSDGTSTGWDFPSYGDGLPHDLCHLVVEEGLGLSEGFWGLVDQHVEVGLVNNQPTLMRDGQPLVDQPGIDFSSLVQAEEAVAGLGSSAIEVDHVSERAVAAIRGRLRELGQRWRTLDDGGSIKLVFSGRPTDSSSR